MQSYLGTYPGSRHDSDVKFIRAVNSFINQNYKNSELVIVSDGCDITHHMYYKYFKNISNIKYVYVDKDGPNMYEGANKYYRGFPREIGRTLSTGDIISYMDSDDILVDNAITILAAAWKIAIEQEPTVMLLSNTSWYDNVIALDHELQYNQVEETAVPIEINGIDDKWYGVKLKPGILAVAPWLQSHTRALPIKWKDTGGNTGISGSEDALFINSLLLDPNVTIKHFSYPIYVRCHMSNLWDY